MKLGISRPTSNVEEAREMLALAVRYGFEGVQFKPNQYQELDAASFAARYGDLARLVCGGLIVYCPSDLQKWVSMVSSVLEFASTTGAGHVCICGGVRRPEGEHSLQQKAASVLNTLGKTARERGVRISLHNHAGSIFESREEILQIAQLLDPALCGLTLDTAHFEKGGGRELESLIPAIKSHLINVHLKDFDSQRRFCPLGHGNVSLKAVVKSLQECGYKEWLIVDEESKHVPVEEAFAISRDYIGDTLS